MRQMCWVVAGLLLSALVLTAGVAGAGQHPQDHDGWSIGFGVGGGSAGVSFDNSEGSSDRTGGGMGSFRVGYPLNPKVTIGLETNGWSKTETVEGVDATVTFTATTVGAAFFPSEGLVLRAGVGLGQNKFQLAEGGLSLSKTESGLGILYGAGYEFRLARTFALGPQLTGGFSTFDGGSANWIGGTLEFNWYFIPKK
jgi:hypothetical protein